jgi:hypothetical protein
VFSTDGTNEECIQNFGRKTKMGKTTWRPRSTFKNNIKKVKRKVLPVP